MFTVFSSDTTGTPGNCLYPHRSDITDPDSLREAVSHDYVCAEYRNSYRSGENFLRSNCLPVDCDNDHSEDPDDWIRPEDIAAAFPGVAFAVHYSRHNMRVKNGKPARPKFHVLFPIDEMTDPAAYAEMKKTVNSVYPYFDTQALDAARFFYGTQDAQVELIQGDRNLTDFLNTADFEALPDAHAAQTTIPAGSRNNTMSRFAGRILKKYGLTDKALEVFREHAEKCDPPLDEEELSTIWRSATRFYQSKVVTSDGYVPPEEYMSSFPGYLKPIDYSDIGQAKVFSAVYRDELIFTSATDFLRYDGTVWIEDKQLAVGAAIEFLDLQLKDAGDLLDAAKKKLLDLGIPETVISAGGKALEKEINDGEQLQAYRLYLAAAAYHAFVMKRRDMKYIVSAMNVSKALLNRSINDMDRNPNLLNTPAGTFDMEYGINGMKIHDAADLITKITECAPGDRGEEIWRDALHTFFCNNEELVRYVQRVVGMAAIGKVYQEHMIIAYGDGANGKSTFWNTVARVLGSYSGKISAEVLTVGNKRNAKPEMAELKGKRLIIASEMEEGMRLNTAMVKQLCSTDDIEAEKKYEQPFHFTPTHTLVLYTNHLPRVGANDEGIWRRLIVIPFNAKITGKTDIKNYSDYLFENAGEAILKWVLEGAADAIRHEFKWPLPAIVQEAINEYREQNDWFNQFVEDCCEVGEGYQESSGAVYDEYRNYCARNGEYTRNSADFYASVEKAGYRRKRTSGARLILGLRLKSDFLEA